VQRGEHLAGVLVVDPAPQRRGLDGLAQADVHGRAGSGPKRATWAGPSSASGSARTRSRTSRPSATRLRPSDCSPNAVVVEPIQSSGRPSSPAGAPRSASILAPPA
jgi:hypothetical protein